MNIDYKKLVLNKKFINKIKKRVPRFNTRLDDDELESEIIFQIIECCERYKYGNNFMNFLCTSLHYRILNIYKENCKFSGSNKVPEIYYDPEKEKVLAAFRMFPDNIIKTLINMFYGYITEEEAASIIGENTLKFALIRIDTLLK